MTETARLKRGDTSPALRVALKPETTDLVGASVVFQMRARRGALKTSAAAVVEDLDPPIVRYDWLAVDTDTAGIFEAEFVVTYGDGSIETFPNGDFIRVIIKEDVR